MIYVRIERRPDPGEPEAPPELLQEISIREKAREWTPGGDLASFVIELSHSTRRQFQDRQPFRGFLDPARPMGVETWRSAGLVGFAVKRSPAELVFEGLRRIFDPAYGGRTGARR